MSPSRYLKEISVIKTLRFNLKYFGFRGGVLCPVLVARNVRLRVLRGNVSVEKFKTGGVRLGFSNVGIFDSRYDRAVWEVLGNVCFGEDVFLGQGFKISVDEAGSLNLSSGFTLNANSSIVCRKRIDIGRRVLMSWDCLVMDTDFHRIGGQVCDREVGICDDVWIGCRSTILKGAHVPSGSVVAAGALLTKEFREENVLLGGCNAILKYGISWER